MYIVKTITNGEPVEIHGHKQKLSSGNVVKGINSIDSFTFSITPKNSGFYKLREFKTLVEVYNTNKNRYDFQGRVLYAPASMDENGYIKKEVVCESFLGYLCDSQQEYRAEQDWTVNGLLQHFIDVHNSQVEREKRITVRNVTVTAPDGKLTTDIQREKTWDAIKKKLIDVLGGEILIEVVNGYLFLDYLTKIGETKTTEIALSKNMKAISREKNPTELVTRLIPLGTKQSDSEERLDISSVNNGKKYIDDEQAVAMYGIHVGYAEFDDVTDANSLLIKGQNWFKENNKVQVKYSITALDLSLLGLDIDDYEVYNSYPVKNHLLEINDVARVIKRNINICEETKSTIEVGDNFKTLSDIQKEQSNKLNIAANNIATIIAKYVTNQKLEDKLTEERSQTTSLINQLANEITLSVSGEYVKQTAFNTYKNTTSAELALKVDIFENDRIVSMLNASADTINIKSNRLSISSSHFTLSPDGTITSIKGKIGGFNIESKYLYNGTDSLTSTDEGVYVGIDGINLGGNFIVNSRGYIVSEHLMITKQTIDSSTSTDYETKYQIGPNGGYSMYLGGQVNGVQNDIGGGLAIINDQTYDKKLLLNLDSTSCSLKLTSSHGDIIFSPGEHTNSRNGEHGVLRGTWEAESAISVTSDKNKKNSIEDISDKYSVFFDNLKPQRFKYNNGNSDRFHTGFIAQEVEEALELSEISQNEFAGIVTFNTDTDEETKALRYEEFIPLNTHEIQKLKNRVAALEKTIIGEQHE